MTNDRVTIRERARGACHIEWPESPHPCKDVDRYTNWVMGIGWIKSVDAAFALILATKEFALMASPRLSHVTCKQCLAWLDTHPQAWTVAFMADVASGEPHPSLEELMLRARARRDEATRATRRRRAALQETREETSIEKAVAEVFAAGRVERRTRGSGR